MQIKFDIPEHEIQAEIKTQMENSINHRVSRTISNLFAAPTLRQTGFDQGGAGTQLITELAETALLSEKTQQRIQNGIEKFLNENLDAAIQEAMDRRIKHEVGRAVFSMKLNGIVSQDQIQNMVKKQS